MTAIVLTADEAELLRVIASGELFTRVARRRYCSESAVAMAALRLRAKVGAITNAHLVDIAYRTGLLAIPVDPSRNPDPELCAGPVVIPGVEGWACGRGLALAETPSATSKES